MRPAALAEDEMTKTLDLHCHGALGFAFDDADLEGVTAAVEYHQANGSDALLLSLVSAPISQLTARLRELQDIIPKVPGAAGVHLEGPFLAPSRRGAHDLRALTVPTARDVSTLIDAGAGILRQITIAPELPGALDAIDAFAAADVVVAVGHTSADYHITHRAFEQGARLLTHTYNAMPGLAHRDPGPIGAALDRGDVILEIIADGQHVHATVLKALFAAAPGRIALVTDAMSATGLGDGLYQLGGLDVVVSHERPVLAGTDTLAGSTLTLSRALAIAQRAGVSTQDAHAAITTTPQTLVQI